MCGLAGIIGDTCSKTKEGFTDLLTITQLRGRDSTGVFSVRRNYDAYFMKSLGTPENITDRKGYDKTIMDGWPLVVAGHCRSKTVGDNTQENAHPYDFENIIGMHNGTLNNYYSMEGYSYKNTDSYCLFYNIDKFGVEEAFEKVNPSGAWALVWWDKVNNTLNFLRNDKRPLWFAWTKDRRCMVWASEPWMFGAMARKIDLWDGKTDEEDTPRSPYFELPINQLWSFSVNTAAKKDEPILKLHPTRKIEARGSSASNFTNTTGYSANGRSSWKSGNQGGEVSSPFTPTVLDDPIDDIGKRLKELREKAAEKARQQPLGLPAPSKTPEESETTGTTVKKSEKFLSKILDFRPAQMRGMNSSERKILSVSTSSKTSQPANNEDILNKSSDCTTPPKDLLKKKTSIRNISGIQYITDNKTSFEWSLKSFEEKTGAICCHCKQPIGELSEVHEFFDKGNKFICTTCIEEPPLCLVG